MLKRKVVLIHTSPAAIAPVVQFYGEAAPELEITNQLDDGILRLFAAGQSAAAEQRLAEMITAAHAAYGAELALLTCSAVSRKMLENLRHDAKLPILKIDDALARRAVQAGQKIGVVVTFPPTLVTTRQLLTDAAAEEGVTIDLVPEVSPEAYQALLAGDHAKHDELLCAAIERLARQGVDVIVLAQVSMARILPQLDGRVTTPVLTSLQTSLKAIRDAFEEHDPAKEAGRNLPVSAKEPS